MNNKNYGVLTLIPTPLCDEAPLDEFSQKLLLNALGESKRKILIVGEEIKVLRRLWIRSGLPKESVDSFIILNEHNQIKQSEDLLKKMLEGYDIFLMSDGGLPAFWDPGQRLVDLCHIYSLKVTAAPFANSIALAIALSGFPHQRVMIEGFLPMKDKKGREKILQDCLKRDYPSVLMEPPYRLQKLLVEIKSMMKREGSGQEVFLGMDLNRENEDLLRGDIDYLLKRIPAKAKREFVLIIGPNLMMEKKGNKYGRS